MFQSAGGVTADSGAALVVLSQIALGDAASSQASQQSHIIFAKHGTAASLFREIHVMYHTSPIAHVAL